MSEELMLENLQTEKSEVMLEYVELVMRFKLQQNRKIEHSEQILHKLFCEKIKFFLAMLFVQ